MARSSQCTSRLQRTSSSIAVPVSVGHKHGKTEIGSGSAHGLRSQSAELHECEMAKHCAGGHQRTADDLCLRRQHCASTKFLGRRSRNVWRRSLFADFVRRQEWAPGNNAGTILTFPIGIVGAGYRGGNPFTFNITTAI